MINPALIPDCVKHLVDTAKDKSLNDWRNITSSWPQAAKEFTIECRANGEQKREQQLVTHKQEFELVAAAQLAAGRGTSLSLTLICLSDEVLDTIIKSFNQ